MRLGLTNVRGTIVERNDSFLKNISKIKEINSENIEADISCRIHALAFYAPDTARKIEIAYDRTNDTALVQNMFTNAFLSASSSGFLQLDVNHSNSILNL